MKPATPEMLAAVEERARLSDNAPLALLALHLREGGDDFECDAFLLLDVISTVAERFLALEPLVAKAIETGELLTSAKIAEDMVRSLEFQLLYARRLEEFLRADVERVAAKPGGAE